MLLARTSIRHFGYVILSAMVTGIFSVSPIKVARRALGFHPGNADAIVAALTKTPISDAPAGQMCVFRPSQISHLSGTAAAVIQLRRSQINARVAVLVVSAYLSPHSCRAHNIRALSTRPDRFSLRIARINNNNYK